MKNEKSKIKGFTLVELLIVIAILGVLAAGIIIAIDPVQQMARARDASRKNNIGQIGTALVSYYASHAASYPTADANWLSNLVNAGELKSVPPSVAYSVSGTSACSTATVVNGYCYNTTGTGGTNAEAVAWTILESKSSKSNCTGTNLPIWFYSTVEGKACGACVAATNTVVSPTQACSFQ